MKLNKKHLVLSLILMGVLFSCRGNTHDHNEEIEIVWIGHSCFEVGFHECRILIDPFSPERFDHILPKTKYDIVFATHKAQDHYYFDGIKADTYLLACGDKNEFISERQDEERNIRGKTIQKTADSSFSYWTVTSFHDDQHGAVEGVNGIICLDFNGIKVVHLGDLGHVLEEIQLEQIGSVDVLMIPIDGYFTIDIDTAKTIIRQLAPKIVFPMHYRTERSRTTRPIYAEEDIVNGFKNVKKLERSHLVVDNEILDQEQQIIILDYLKKEDFPILKGPYLGQKPPGMTPELFAPGIISTEKREFCSVFSPDGKEFFFSRKHGDILMMHFSQQINGKWTKPQAFPYNDGTFNGDMNFSPDGKRLYFCSNRKTDEYLGDLDIWYCERTETGWSGPIHMGTPVNSPASDTYPIFTQNGGLYFGSTREGGKGDKDVYYCRFINGKYTEPVPLGEAINTEYGEGDTSIPFNESFMIINSWGRPDEYGSGDLYVSFKLPDGTWSQARNMGETINTEYTDFCPMMSPDGKHLFFSSKRRGEYDIYWVDAKIIEKLKPTELK